jgi:hypothetical protein
MLVFSGPLLPLRVACARFIVFFKIYPMFIFGHSVVENTYVPNTKYNEWPRDPKGWLFKNPKQDGVKQVYPM